MRNLADPQHRPRPNFVSALSATAAEVAPVAEIQGQLFVDLDTTFGAFARVSRPFIQETISRSPADRGHGDRDAADDPALAGQHREALRRAAARASTRSRRSEGARTVRRRGRQGPAARAGLQRPARPDRPGAAQPLQQRQRPRRASTPSTDFNNTLAPPLSLHHPGPVGLQLRHAALPQRRELPQLRQRHRHQPAVHRAAAADRARTARSAPARRRPTAAARPPTSSTTTRTRTPRRRARRTSARRATSPTSPASR